MCVGVDKFLPKLPKILQNMVKSEQNSGNLNKIRPDPVWVWDKWQKEVLEHEGNVTLRTGRQVGKSVTIGEKAKRFALGHPNTVVLVIAASQRQSSLLFEKIHGALLEEEGEKIFAEIPTLTKIILKNGSKILCLPAGKTGHFIRGFTVDLLIADEAAYIPEIVWNSVIPMIAVSRKTRGFGWLFLLSTPFGKGGFYFDTFTDPDFRSWHVSSENCKRIPKSLLLKERKRMTKVAYAQEWLGEFMEDWNQFFPTKLLKRAMTFIDWDKSKKWPTSSFYLGVDVARYGGDECAFVIVELDGYRGSERMRCVKCITTERKSTVDTIGRVLALNAAYKFKMIFIDDAGVGGAVTDVLIEKLGRKVVGLNNACKSVEVQGDEKRRGILKEDLYSNTLVLLENKKLELISDLSLLRSLKSITFEYSTKIAGRVTIFGDYSHLAEALVRACWCVKERGLKVYLY